ncbi:MAG: DUF885 domain-containing protein [Flavobacterium sp.]|nr:DUF885 domain-containing protein [Flavobacterium sp.]
MKKAILLFATAIAMISCQKSAKEAASKNKSFDNYKAGFVEAMWKLSPEYASSIGYHKYDSMLTIPDKANRERQLAFSKANLDSLKKYDMKNLNATNITDYRMIENQLQSQVFGITELKSYEWDPSQYNVCGPFAEILNGNYAPLKERLQNFSVKMENIQAYYEAAKQQIKNPTLEHTQLAIEQNLGGISVFEKDFIEALKKADFSPKEVEDMTAKANKAVASIRDFADFLKNTDNKTPRSFRLGADLYAKKFEFDIQAGSTADAIYEKAVAHKQELHEKMFALADKLWPKYMENAKKPTNKLDLIRQVIDKISLQHTKPELFQSEIEKQIPQLIAYIKKKDLIYIDPSKPLVVRKEPDYMAGVAGASISAPGPYDKNANTYYNVGSLSGWPTEKAESYLREYNDYILQILNMHEAIPGHYTQLVYSNQSPSIIKSVFGNGAMVEGWAVYTELMMLESGYANSDEMWLMYYKWNLRTTCNTILDNSVHTKDMSKEAALELLTKEAFQQKAEAEGKWKRVTLTQVQLCSYFTGYSEIYDLRNEIKAKMGKKFNLKAFHEKFLSYGSAPVKYIRELMLEDLR